MSRVPTHQAALVRCLRLLLLPLDIRNHRAEVKRLTAGERPIKGRGAWKDHAALDIFVFTAICGQPVSSIGGPASEADCRACRRLLRRGRAA